jgi:hypothetical protein
MACSSGWLVAQIEEWAWLAAEMGLTCCRDLFSNTPMGGGGMAVGGVREEGKNWGKEKN